jgi:hypothetical protein
VQAAAYPMLYDLIHKGCKIPAQMYKGHGTPVPNANVRFFQRVLILCLLRMAACATELLQSRKPCM